MTLHEQYVIGKLLSSPELVAQVMALGLEPRFLEERINRLTLATAYELWQGGHLATPEIVAGIIGDQWKGDIEEVKAYYYKLIAIADTPVDEFDFRLEQLYQHTSVAAMREILEEASGIVSGKFEPHEKLAEVSKLALGLLDYKASTEVATFTAHDAVSLYLDGEQESPLITPTPFVDLNNIIKGFRHGRITVIGGGTNHGKSLFTDACLLGTALYFKKKGIEKQVVKFDCENGVRASITRFCSMLAARLGYNITTDEIDDHRSGLRPMSSDRLEQFEHVKRELAMLPLVIDETTGPDSGYVDATVMSRHQIVPVGMVGFDYLDFVGDQADHKTLAIENAMKRFHAVAKRLDIPWLAVSQVKSAAEALGPPTIHDLSWSDAIRKISATVIMVHSDWVLWDQTGNTGKEPDPTRLGLYIRKNKGARSPSRRCRIGYRQAYLDLHDLQKHAY